MPLLTSPTRTRSSARCTRPTTSRGRSRRSSGAPWAAASTSSTTTAASPRSRWPTGSRRRSCTRCTGRSRRPRPPSTPATATRPALVAISRRSSRRRRRACASIGVDPQPDRRRRLAAARAEGRLPALGRAHDRRQGPAPRDRGRARARAAAGRSPAPSSRASRSSSSARSRPTSTATACASSARSAARRKRELFARRARAADADPLAGAVRDGDGRGDGCGTPVIAFPEGAAAELVDRRDDRVPRRRRGRDGRGGRPRSARSTRARCRAWVAERCDVDVVAAAYERTLPSAMQRRAPRGARRGAMPERTLSVLDGSTFLVGDRLGDMRADDGREHGFFSRGHALRLALGPARRRGAAAAARPRPGRALRRPFFLAPGVSARRRRALLDHAPPAGRPRVDGGDHRHQPPPRPQRAASWSTGGRRRLRRPVRGQGRRRAATRRSYRHARRPHARAALPHAATSCARRGSPRAGRRPITRRRLRVRRCGSHPARQWSRRPSRSRRIAAQPGTRSAARRAGDLDELAPAKAAELDALARARAGAGDDRRGARAHLRAQPQRPRARCACTRPRRPAQRCPAAGLPWFMALFGRDSLITSYQALPYRARAAPRRRCACSPRARRRTRDDFRDEEPGKILHELRFGELTAHRRAAALARTTARPTRRRCSSSCSTSTSAGRATTALVRALEPNARAALTWIDRLRRPRRRRLRRVRSAATRRPGWSTSAGRTRWNSILFADGRLAERPIATCEIQGYVYDAQAARGAAGARGLGRPGARRPARAPRPTRCAARFNRDFWMRRPRLLYALALDGDKRQVDSLTSNIGHLLWCGIVDESGPRRRRGSCWATRCSRAGACGRMAAGEAGYNPLGYHNGTVWPHDNSLIAARPRAVRPPRGGDRIAAAHPRRGRALRAPPARGLRGLPARRSPRVPVEFPTASQPAGVGRGGAAAAADHAPRPVARAGTGSAAIRTFPRRSATSC